MNIIITAEVTYEIQGVKDINEARSIFQTCVASEARHMEGVSYVGSKEAFATKMNEDMTIDPNPQTWELGEI